MNGDLGMAHMKQDLDVRVEKYDEANTEARTKTYVTGQQVSKSKPPKQLS